MPKQWTGRVIVHYGPGEWCESEITDCMIRDASTNTTCGAAITRGGDYDACDRPAVALRAYEFDGGAYVDAVCRGHIGDTEHTVPLAEILRVAKGMA